MYKYLFIFLLATSFAQVSDYAYTGAQASAMVGAVVSDRGGNWSIFHNPAGMAEIDGTHFSVGSGRLYGLDWLPLYHFNGTIPLPIIGKIGFAIQQLETKLGSVVLSKEQTISIAQGFNLQKDKNSHLSMGYTANFIQWDLGKSSGQNGDGDGGFELGSVNSITIDFGVLASLRKRYRFGVFIKNINSGALGKGMTRQILPRRINMGITYNPTSDLTTSIIGERLLGRDDLQIKGAIRYNLISYLEICAGAQSNPNRFGSGIRFTVKSKSISYGILTHPVLPMTQQINLSISL